MTSAEREMQFRACCQRCLPRWVKKPRLLGWPAHKFRSGIKVCVPASDWNTSTLSSPSRTLQHYQATSGWGSGGQVTLSQGVGDGHITRQAIACMRSGYALTNLAVFHLTSRDSWLLHCGNVATQRSPDEVIQNVVTRQCSGAASIQARPCVPSGSTLAPRGHWCGSRDVVLLLLLLLL